MNPNHLWLGTYKDNAQDRNKKGRGYKLSNKKLSEEQVVEIFMDKTKTVKEMASKFGVHISTIDFIRQRRSWRFITSLLI